MEEVGVWVLPCSRLAQDGSGPGNLPITKESFPFITGH